MACNSANGTNRPALAACVLIFVTGATVGGWAGYLNLSGNIHEVEAGTVFRSAQLDSAKLASVIQEKHIQTIINLRGANPGQKWFDDEIAVSQQAGVRHIDVRMSAIREPDDALVRELLDVLGAAQKPYLIHCNAGADRTGLAAALYLARFAGQPAAAADEQLSFRYGHFPWLTSHSGAMDRTFWRVVATPSLMRQEATR